MPEDERSLPGLSAAAGAQARRNLVTAGTLAGGLLLSSALGMLPAAAALAFGMLVVAYAGLVFWWLRGIRHGRWSRRVAMAVELYPIVGITACLPLMGELGPRLGVPLYFLMVLPGQRRFSGQSPFVAANLAAACFALLQVLDVHGWIVPLAFWGNAPAGPALGAATAVGACVLLNGMAVAAHATNRELAARGTALERANATLVERNAQLRHLQGEFERYASGVVHDLANPLGAAIEGIQALETVLGGSDGETRELAGLTRRSMARALEMLGGLREITKTVAADEEFAEVSMDDLLDAAVAEFSLSLRARRIRLTKPSELPRLVVQRAKILQVWRNLIGNAVKYADTHREPAITISHRPIPEGHEFAIADNGIGIPPEFAGRVFEAFERLPAAAGGPVAGMGLGLTLVKRVVEQHGGSVTVESVPGTGSTFRFTLARRESGRAAA